MRATRRRGTPMTVWEAVVIGRGAGHSVYSSRLAGQVFDTGTHGPENQKRSKRTVETKGS
jgi:hypothetical protein